MGKIKIVFFLDVMVEDYDGVAITMHQIIRRIPRDEFDAVFITPHPPTRSVGFQVYECPYFVLPEKGKEYRVGLPKRMKNLSQILDDYDPDLIHFSSPTFMGWFALKYARKRQLPVTTIYHTHYPSFLTYYFKKLPFLIHPVNALISRIYAIYRHCSKVFAPTDSMRRFLLTKHVPNERMIIWGRGVDVDRFNPDKRDPELWSMLPKEHKKVLFVSRLVKEKEPDTLVRLYAEITKKQLPMSLVIVGEGPFRDYLKSKMPKAHFAGALYGIDLARAYASSDVFIFPSTTETFGNVVLEALASGLPVVAANAGGPSDIVKNEETGFLVEPQNEKEFLGKILQLTENEVIYKRISNAARAYAETQTWDKLSAQLFNNYREVVAGNQLSEN